MNDHKPSPRDNPGTLVPSSPHTEQEKRSVMREDFDDAGFAGRLATILLLPARFAALIRSFLWWSGRAGEGKSALPDQARTQSALNANCSNAHHLC